MKTNLFLVILFFLLQSACTSKEGDLHNSINSEAQTLEKNKSIVKAVFEELINKRNGSAIDTLYAASMIDHSPFKGDAPGIEGFRKSVEGFISMFPDLTVSVEEMIAEGDKIATRESWKGTHVTTKKVLTGETLHVFRIANGKITDEWSKGWEWLENQ